MSRLHLPWSDYKSMDGSRSVYFAGGLWLYVINHDHKHRPTDRWRVLWYVGQDEGVMRGLTDKRFKTRYQAQLAAERVFVPISKIAHEMVKVRINTKVEVL